ncbi:MAG TPA: hypothetical protein VFQ61_38735 [Polyangiaceae bacterium]|nr:hypothetical protein [Polyangiaceae bacterium]
MWIDARQTTDDSFRLVYRVHDSEHALFADTLEYRRVRGSWNPTRTGPSESYPALARWIASRLFALRPRAAELRIRMERLVLHEDGSGFDGTGEFFYEVRVTRSELSP